MIYIWLLFSSVYLSHNSIHHEKAKPEMRCVRVDLKSLRHCCSNRNLRELKLHGNPEKIHSSCQVANLAGTSQKAAAEDKTPATHGFN